MDKHGMSYELVRGSTLPDMTGAMRGVDFREFLFHALR
jgi:hypothetical protein